MVAMKSFVFETMPVQHICVPDLVVVAKSDRWAEYFACEVCFHVDVCVYAWVCVQGRWEEDENGGKLTKQL